MPESRTKRQAINIYRSNSISIKGKQLADEIQIQMDRSQVGGSIHSLIDLDTSSLEINRSQSIQNSSEAIPVSTTNYSTQPLGELIKLADERNKALREVQR